MQQIQKSVERFIFAVLAPELLAGESSPIVMSLKPVVQPTPCPEGQVAAEVLSYMPCGDRVDDTMVRLAINPAPALKEEKKQ